MNEKNSVFNKFAFIVLMAVFGCLGPIVRAIGFPSQTTACIRAWIAALSLIAYILISRRKFTKKNILLVLKPMIISGIALAVDWIGLFTSYSYTTIATSTICYYIVPILVIIASALILKEKLTIKHIICAIVAFIGMVFVSGVLEPGAFSIADIKGILFALLGAVGYTAVVIINKKYPEGDVFLRTAVQLLVAAIVTTPFVFISTDVSSLVFSTKSIGLLLLLGVGLTTCTYIFYFDLILKLPSRSVAIISYMDPVVAVFISLFFMDEPITIFGIIGTVLILGSAIISEFITAKKES